ncbi:hypothetical protein HDU67_006286 [Dinochytrium kinnereticum]|nr:hypothetical protein HDU67_006286 [Dinochytrium kinnereticum]
MSRLMRLTRLSRLIVKIQRLKVTRSNAILIVRRWVFPDHPVLGKLVEDFALTSLKVLLGSPLKVEGGDEKEEVKEKSDEKKGGWEENEAVRHFELFFALCSKKHDLLIVLFLLFSSFPEEVATYILAHIEPLIRSMSSNMTGLIGTLKGFPGGAEALALRIVNVLCDAGKKTSEFVKAVLEIYKQKDLSAVFLVPVIEDLNRAEMLASLPKLLVVLDKGGDESKMVEEKLVKLITPPPINLVVTETKQPLMTPAEFMVAVHNLEETSGLRICLRGVRMCFDNPELFTQEVLGVVIQRLMEQTKTPALLMKTVLESVKLYPQLTGFSLTVLTRLVAKKVWTNKNLWEGFIRCCVLVAPDSFPILAGLPQPQLEEMLAKSPGLKPRLFEYIAALPPQRAARMRHIMALVTPPAPPPEEGGRRDRDYRYDQGGPSMNDRRGMRGRVVEGH